MGKKDIRNKEKKKPKKDVKKIPGAEIVPAPATVEVIRKGKKDRPSEE